MILLNLYQTSAQTIVSVLFIFLLIVYLLGFRLRKLLERKGFADSTSELGTLEGSLLALFAFFLGFTFNLAANRYDARRQVIISEANAISTAIIRADLYPDSTRQIMRVHFKNYVTYRLDYFNAGVDEKQIAVTLANSQKESEKIWALSTLLAQDIKYTDATRLMIPALNEMMDAVTTRDATKNAKVPDSILWVLFALSIFSAFIVGYSTKGKKINFITGFIFIAMISISIYLIIDLDRPRRGIITLKDSNNKILELKTYFEKK